MRRGIWLAPVMLAAAVAAAGAQTPADSAIRPPRLGVELSRAPDGTLRPPVVRAGGALAGGMFGDALRDGFPVRYHFRLELRRSVPIFADHLESNAEWEAVVLLDPLTNEFDVVRSGGTEEHFTSKRALERGLGTAFSVDLLPRRHDQYYYVAVLEIESLSLSELDEAERWLRGDLGPALSKRGDVGNSLGRGLRRVLIRLSGLPRLTLESRSAYFRP